MRTKKERILYAYAEAMNAKTLEEQSQLILGVLKVLTDSTKYEEETAQLVEDRERRMKNLSEGRSDSRDY